MMRKRYRSPVASLSPSTPDGAGRRLRKTAPRERCLMTDRQIITVALCAFAAVGSVIVAFAAQPAEYPSITARAAVGRANTAPITRHRRRWQGQRQTPSAGARPRRRAATQPLRPAIRSPRPPLDAATPTSSARCSRRPVDLRPRHSRPPCHRPLRLRRARPRHQAPPGHQAPPATRHHHATHHSSHRTTAPPTTEHHPPPQTTHHRTTHHRTTHHRTTHHRTTHHRATHHRTTHHRTAGHHASTDHHAALAAAIHLAARVGQPVDSLAPTTLSRGAHARTSGATQQGQVRGAGTGHR